MVLPTDKGCYFLDSRVRYKSELRLGYRPGDRDLTEYGVGEKGGGEEVVILMVSAGGGRTELNLRTMSEMLRRYFFQNANIEHDEYGKYRKLQKKYQMLYIDNYRFRILVLSIHFNFFLFFFLIFVLQN